MTRGYVTRGAARARMQPGLAALSDSRMNGAAASRSTSCGLFRDCRKSRNVRPVGTKAGGHRAGRRCLLPGGDGSTRGPRQGRAADRKRLDRGASPKLASRMANIGHQGAVEGQLFDGRAAIHKAGLHLHTMRGIAGRGNGPAEAIVLSGGYVDDIDLGDEIIYTGEGGRDGNTGQQVSDQTLSEGNEALVNSGLEGTPVRVFRRTGKGREYRYDGLYYVERSWPERPPSHGFLIYRYRLLKATPDAEGIVPPPPAPPGQPPRVPSTIQRVVRSTAVAQGVKEAHDYRCQVCGVRVDLPEGKRYAEAAHIRPLGLPFNGPDVESNVLALCPTHHVMFDYGAVYVDTAGQVIDAITGHALGALRTAPSHNVDPGQLTHHRERWTLI